MIASIRNLWRDRKNRLWVLPAVNSVGAVLLALMAAWVPAGLPESLSLPRIPAETLSSLLTVVSSSMLAVTTFSLSIMVSAFASASSGVTPRATELVMGDEGTREAIATFLSAFIFSLVAQIALGLKYYSDDGRFILFVGTLAVLVWLIVALLRWVRTLSSLGRLSNTLGRVQKQAHEVLTAHWLAPWLGGKASPGNLQALLDAPGAMLVKSDRVAVLRHLDLANLQSLAEKNEVQIHLVVRPGALRAPGDVLAVLEPDAGKTLPDSDREALLDSVQAAICLDDARTFDQDPRFGLIVLREAGQRSLSSDTNDPGTSILCLNAMTRVLLESQTAAQKAKDAGQAKDEPPYARLTLPGLNSSEFVTDTMDPMIRDGAHCYDVMTRLFKQLAMLSAKSPDPVIAETADKSAKFAMSCVMQTMTFEQDRNDMQALYRQLFEGR